MLPKKLKFMNLFNEGRSFLNMCPTVTLPVLTRILEDYRGGGMDGAAGYDMGQEPLEMEWTVGGLPEGVLEQYGEPSAAGLLLRWAGSYQRDDDGATSAVEVVVRGRHQAIDMGEQAVGEDTDTTVTSRLTYYKLTIDGVVKIEIDLLGMVFNVNGVDRLAQHRANIGA